jgi:cobaltochelatase CobS
VLRILSKNRNVFMVGSAGTGKTTIAERAAQALGLEFSAQSFNAQSSKADLVGFQTANGVYVGTEFRKRFENGGVYLMDEIDNANPNILGTLNAALANGYMAFPDGMVKRHDGFVAIAAGNTYGNGATAQYVGRNPIDAATKDRFVFVDILIDENVEDAMVQATGLDAAKATEWLAIVRQCRKNVTDHGLQIIVSPRAAENGAHLIDAGFSTRETVDMTILKGAKPEVADKVLAGVTL